MNHETPNLKQSEDGISDCWALRPAWPGAEIAHRGGPERHCPKSPSSTIIGCLDKRLKILKTSMLGSESFYYLRRARLARRTSQNGETMLNWQVKRKLWGHNYSLAFPHDFKLSKNPLHDTSIKSKVASSQETRLSKTERHQTIALSQFEVCLYARYEILGCDTFSQFPHKNRYQYVNNTHSIANREINVSTYKWRTWHIEFVTER